MISGPSPGAKTRLLYFNTNQHRVVTGLLAGNNILRRMGLTNSPICRRCATEDETSVHIFCECEALALGSFFLDPENIQGLSVGPSGTLAKGQSSPELVSDYGAQMARF